MLKASRNLSNSPTTAIYGHYQMDIRNYQSLRRDYTSLWRSSALYHPTRLEPFNLLP